MNLKDLTVTDKRGIQYELKLVRKATSAKPKDRLESALLAEKISDITIFREWVKACREALGFNQTQLAAAVQTKQGNISLLESGKRPPRPKLKNRLIIRVQEIAKSRGINLPVLPRR